MRSDNTLRLQVEDILRADEDEYTRIPAEDVQSLMRQLQIQQIALELENKELRELHGRLREKRDHYRRLFERIPNCCIVLDADQTVRAANEPAASVLQREPSELIGSNWRDLVHPEDRSQWDSQLQRPGIADGAEELNIRIAVQGQLISDRWWCCQTRNDQGDLESVLLVLPVGQISQIEPEDSATSDLTGGPRDSAESCCRLMAAMSRDAVIGVSADGTIQTWNPAAERLLGIDAKTAVGTSILRIATLAGWTEARQLYSAIRRQASITEHHTHLQTEDARLRNVILNCRPVGNAGSHSTGSLITIRNITPPDTAGHPLYQREHEADHHSRMESMGEMIAILAHELSQPLTVINGCAETCANWLETDESDHEHVQDAISRINQQSVRAGAVIRNLRRFVVRSVHTGAAIDLNEEIREVCSLMKSQIEKHSTTVQLSLDESLPMIQADGLRIQQAIVHLLQNSLQAMKEVNADHRWVVISTGVLPDALQVVVTDNGHGIPPDVGDRVFDPHFSTRNRGPGMGLGICRQIIQSHGGALRRIQNPDSTTTFEFTLPRSDR